MAKEMMIVFVYDNKVAEDPENTFDGIVYFHPNWVPEQQRTALCGQVIGASQCLKSILFSPRLLSLQTGKFHICEFGRYIMVVGSDRNINDWILEYRANLLSSLLSFYHKDLEYLSDLYPSTDSFMTKLYYILETYLNLLVYGQGGNVFNNMITLQLPKSASCVFLDAVQILRSCQRVDNVLGGTLLYHNKVVTTQLSLESTKWLVLSNPYHFKSSAEIVKTEFDLPLGSKLLQVYIKEDEYNRLKREASIFRSPRNLLNNQLKPSEVKEPVLQRMKRDQSLLFTTVPEEGESPTFTSGKSIAPRQQNRPKFLNLKSKTTDINIEGKLDSKPITSTPYLGSTSICSTPMTDLNKVLHQNLMSICLNHRKIKENVEDNKIRGDNTDQTINTLLSGVSDDEKVQDKCNVFRENLIKKSNSYNDISKVGNDCMKCHSRRKSVADPTFPMFSTKGLPMSEYCYNHFICNDDMYGMQPQKLDAEHESEILCSLQDVHSSVENKVCEKDNNFKGMTEEIVDRKNNMELRKALSLPLKPTSNPQTVLRQNSILTPLMSKLSLLAMQDKSPGFSCDVTPCDYKDLKSMKKTLSFLNSTKSQTQTEQELKPVILFICGQQDMAVNLFLEEEALSTDCINKIYGTCIDHLGRLDKQIRQCLEIHPGGGTQGNSNDPYSFLSMNSNCDTIQRVGIWGSSELTSVARLHRDFMTTPTLTEIIIRSDIFLIYGNNYGSTEVYYNQSAPSSAGLPTPADAMSNISLKAKRRLDRDFAIILH